MDNIITSWAFGFGGWIGVFSTTFLFLNVPHNYTFLTLLLSPWLGGISLYLLMFGVHAWIHISMQVAKAMIQYEIILAVLTSCIGVLVVAIARLIIEMDRGHRTLAQVAAEEPAPLARDGEDGSGSGSGKESEDGEDGSGSGSGKESEDGEDGSGSGSGKESEDGEEGSESAGSDKESEDESGEGSGSEDESGSGGESGTDGSETCSDESDNDESNDAALNDAVIEDSSSSSYENINTPQLGAQPSRESPVPVIPDI